MNRRGFLSLGAKATVGVAAAIYLPGLPVNESPSGVYGIQVIITDRVRRTLTPEAFDKVDILAKRALSRKGLEFYEMDEVRNPKERLSVRNYYGRA